MEFSNVLLDIATLPVYLLFFLIIGKLVYGNLYKFFTDPIVNSFLQLTMGFVLSICFFAIFKTFGKSIMVLFVLLMIGQYLYLKMRPDRLWFKKFSASDFKIIGLFFVFALIFLAVQLIRHDYFNPDVVKLGWGDYGFYSDIAESFNIYGIEKGNSWFNYFNSTSVIYESNPIAYHYFEIWTHALFLNTSFNSGMFTFLYLFIPFVCAFVGVAFYTLGQTYLNRNGVKVKATIFFVSLMMPFFMGKLPMMLGGLQDNILFYPRNFLFYILFILFLIFYRKNQKNAGLFFIAALSCVNILYLPTVSVVLVLLGMVMLVKKRDKKTILNILFLGVIPALFVFLFYFVVFKSNSGRTFDFSFLDDLTTYVYKIIRYYFRLNLFRIWLFYLPLFLFTLVYFWTKRSDKKLLSFYFQAIFLIFGLELVSLFFASSVPHLESGTLNSVVLNPMCAVLTFCALFYLLKNKGLVARKFLVGALSFQMVYSVYFVMFNVEEGPYDGRVDYGKEFLKELAHLDIKNKIGGFYKSTENREDSPFAAKSNLSWYTAIFDHKGNGYFQVALTSYIKAEDIPFEAIKGLEMNSTMFKYGNYQLKKDSSISREDIEINFIKEYNLEYIILNPDVPYPIYLNSYTQKIIEDPYSKIRVIVLNKE